MNENIPFNNITNNDFTFVTNNGVDISRNGISIDFTPSIDMQNHIDGLNEYLNKLYTLPSDDDDEENDISPLNCKYYSPDEFCKAKTLIRQSLFLFLTITFIQYIVILIVCGLCCFH